MISALLRTQRAQFNALAEAWLAAGASAYAIWSGGAQLAIWPQAAAVGHGEGLSAPVRLDGLVIGELRVNGVSGAAHQDRLRAEAGLVTHLARLERDLNSMTTELIDTQDQLLAMYDLTQASRNYQTMGQILKQLAVETNRLVKVEGAFLVLQMPDGPLLLEHFPRPLIDRQVLEQYVSRSRNAGHELLVDRRSEPDAPFHNLLLMPIHVDGAQRATLGLVNKLGRDITAPHIKLARAIAEHAGARIENILLYEQNLQRARLQTEMELAQNVQLNLLPHESPQISGLDLWAGSRPASQVGGDFYDFILRPSQPLTFTVGDVSGKGMPAAMLMTMMRTVVRSKMGALPGPTPEQVVTRSNEELYDDFTDLSMFATMFIGQYEPDSRKLVYANAGHSPVVYCPVEGSARLLEADGTAIGILPTSFSLNQQLVVRPGDVLVVATDGLNEARNAQDELFGYVRLLELIESLADRSARHIADALFRTVQSFSAGKAQEDDQTLIVIKGIAE